MSGATRHQSGTGSDLDVGEKPMFTTSSDSEKSNSQQLGSCGAANWLCKTKKKQVVTFRGRSLCWPGAEVECRWVECGAVESGAVESVAVEGGGVVDWYGKRH